jgi:hypothetical protein
LIGGRRPYPGPILPVATGSVVAETISGVRAIAAENATVATATTANTQAQVPKSTRERRPCAVIAVSDHVLRNWQQYRCGQEEFFEDNYLTATRAVEVADLKAIMHAKLICVFFCIMHLMMRPSLGMASEHKRITSGVQAATCSSVYANAGAIVKTVNSSTLKVRM